MLAPQLVADSNEASQSNHTELQRLPAVLRLFPSLTDFAFLAPLLLLFLRLDGVKTMLGDGDTGWHIRAGEWMLANGRVPTEDMFSYTMSSSPWFAWEWLSDIILALAHQKFGLAGPVCLGMLLLCLTSALLFRLCRSHTSNDLIAMAVTCIAIAASSIHWLARPHLFTLLFLVVSLHILDRARRNQRLLWIFPPMVALWTNLHGAFLLIIILLITVGIGIFLEIVTGPQNVGIRSAWQQASRYFTVALASSAASILNPYGWNLHLHIYKYLSEDYHFDYISEFQTLSFHSPVAFYYESLIIFGLLAAAWSCSQRRFADGLLLISWLHFSLVAGRNIPIYALLAAPVISRFFTEAIAGLKSAPVASWIARSASAAEGFGKGFTQLDRSPRWHLTSGIATLLLFFLIVGAPAEARKLKAEYDVKKYPTKALPLLEGKRVFTNDEWGDYLIYMLYPNQKVFVDGRSDFYGPDFCLKYLDVLNARWDWASILSKYRVDAVLLPVSSPLATVLKFAPGWRAVYDDHSAILFFAVGKGALSLRDGNASNQYLSEARKLGPIRGPVLELAKVPNPLHSPAQATNIP